MFKLINKIVLSILFVSLFATNFSSAMEADKDAKNKSINKINVELKTVEEGLETLSAIAEAKEKNKKFVILSGRFSKIKTSNDFSFATPDQKKKIVVLGGKIKKIKDNLVLNKPAQNLPPKKQDPVDADSDEDLGFGLFD